MRAPILAAVLGVLLLVAGPLSASPTYYNGVASYAPGNGYDAPIFRQFAFVEGVVTQYHVLSPESFPTDARLSHIYQFPACATIRPVIEDLPPIPGHPLGATDSPSREIVNVVLMSGCAYQPRSDEEVLALAVQMVETEMYVNAPIIPAPLDEWTDEQLYNGPPFMPRLTAYQNGAPVKFITYEASWYPTWLGTRFPNQAADVFIISYGSLFRPGFSILNSAVGTPLHDSFTSYSPIWSANCIVDADDQKCMLSVNLNDPSYYQCRSVAECTSMVNSKGHQVEVTKPNTFTHINCPMVAVDLNADSYIAPNEEIPFPRFWANGPVVA